MSNFSVVRLSSMVGWEWVIPPEREQELIKILNQLGTERPSRAMHELADRLEGSSPVRSASPAHAAFAHLVDVAEDTVVSEQSASVTGFQRDLQLASRHAKRIYEVCGRVGFVELERFILAKSGHRAEADTLDKLKRQNERLKELYQSSLQLIRRYQQERDGLLKRVGSALLAIESEG